MSDTNTNAGANETTPGRNRRWIIAAIVAVVLIVAAVAIVRGRRGDEKPANAEAAEEHHDEGGGNAVELGPEAAAAADIQLVAVTQRSAVVPLRTTGTIEANEQRMQQVSPLVNGRVDRVYAAPGDRVRAGAVLAELSSPEVAELKGKLLEAHSRQNLADANLRRLRKLNDLGAAAGKDLAAAESEAQTAQAEVAHIRGSLSALGADASGGRSIGTLALRAPIGGTITQRFVNPGAGVQAGSPVFAIADLSSVWVIANVPEAQVQLLTIGSEARVHSAALGQQVAAGRVSYIDPILNEETRTARVRIESANPDQRLKIGTFVDVNFITPTPQAEGTTELVIPDDAVQTVENRTVVFVPAAEPNHYAVRDVQVGGSVDGMRKVVAGLTGGERVVTKGSFVLKTQLLKGEMGEHGH